MNIDLNKEPLLPYEAILKDRTKAGRSTLREKSVPFSFPLDETDKLRLREIQGYLDEGYDDEYAEKWEIRPGVGLALPQVGFLKRGFALRARDEDGTECRLLVLNPVITSTSLEQVYLGSGEGCLSVEHDVQGLVMRARRITARFMSYDAEKDCVTEETRKFHDLLAVVFQHEYDHLDGILFYDRINKKDPYAVPANASEVELHKKK